VSPQPTESPPEQAAQALVRARPPLQQLWRRLSSSVRAQPPLHTLYLGSNGVLSWPAAAAPKTKNKTKHEGDHTSPSQATACADFKAWCAAHENSAVCIFVSGHLLHSLVVDPALKLADDTAVRAYALQQFSHYHGPAARQWPLAVWSHASKTQHQAGACALHGVDMAALHSTARAHGVRLRSVSPVWSAGLSSATSRWPAQAHVQARGAKPARHAVALIEGHLLTWMLLQSGTVLALEQRYLDAPDWPAASHLVAQLSSDSGPLAAPAALVAWGLPPAAAGQPSAQVPVPMLCANDSHRTIGAWVLDAVGAV
jgi:hypothetical protein